MIARLSYLWNTVIGPQILWWVLWIGLAAITIALLVLMRTRWGQSRPLGKCLALSLLAHLLLAGYGTSVQIVHNTMKVAQEQALRITRVDGVETSAPPETPESPAEKRVDAWNTFESSADIKTDQPEVAPEADAEVSPETEVTERAPLENQSEVADAPPTETPVERAEAEPLVADMVPKVDTPTDLPEQIEALPAEREDEVAIDAPPVSAPGPERPAGGEPSEALAAPQPPAVALPVDPLLPADLLTPNPGVVTPDAMERLVDIDQARQKTPTAAPLVESPPPILPDELIPAASGAAAVAANSGQGPVTLEKAQDPAPPTEVPEPYEQRLSNRAELAVTNGGSKETEDAVNKALAWLAKNQSDDGHWDANRFGAGREMKVGGEDRRGAGAGADTGVTGLALLAMLGAGNTQLQGEHRECVRKGLEYLLSQQAADGNLAGRAGLFARMYSHAMATIALGEAYGLTKDDRLREPLRKAVQYSVTAQNQTTGGWRYEPWRVQPGERGDTSQLGWQLMALRSAELAGIPVPAKAKEGMSRFLRSVSFGTYGGLASYREGEGSSRAMTAEALACRLFLGLNQQNTTTEATDFVLQELPTSGRSNMYYWYYATLALYQVQGESWQRWNSALKGALISGQIKDGEMAGSWDTADLWGGHGGRVYTTAMGALCLEVYYRYLPLYGQAIAREPQNRAAR